jgi:hypothetical protein
MTTQLHQEYLTIKEFCKRYASIVSEGSMRWILFNSKQNHANFFVRRLGKRKLLISPELFFQWLETDGKRG